MPDVMIRYRCVACRIVIVLDAPSLLQLIAQSAEAIRNGERGSSLWFDDGHDFDVTLVCSRCNDREKLGAALAASYEEESDGP